MRRGFGRVTERTGELGLGRLAVTVLAPFATGYFMAYVFRSVNAVVAPDLVNDLGLTATALGVLTAAYFFGYGAWQLPLGVLLDRFGPRRVQAAMFLVSGVGGLLFALGRDQTTLALARGLIGLGFAGGLMSAFKAIVIWVPKERLPLANGCVMSCGGLGALMASAPADFLVQLVGWRWTFVVLSLATFVAAAIIFTVVPEKSGTAPPANRRDQLAGLARIYGDPFFWRIAPLAAAHCGFGLAFQTLWSGPWLRDMLGFDRNEVALRLAALALAFAAGSLTGGALADVARRRFGIGVLSVMNGLVVLFLFAHLGLLFEATRGNIAVWLVFGALGQITILTFPVASEHFGPALAGRANTGLNLVVFLTAFAIQAAVGAILDLWPRGPSGGYDQAAYDRALQIFLALEVATFLWFLMDPFSRRRPETKPAA
jgi:predicted MFS family arabinose efflux permease